MNRNILITALILGLLAVILGAFGAHGLKEIIDESAIKSFETGVRYQMYHGLLLLFIGSTNMLSSKTKKRTLLLVIFGIIFFSVSIYLLSANVITSFDFKSIGFITPIGGLLLIISWLLVLIDVLKKK